MYRELFNITLHLTVHKYSSKKYNLQYGADKRLNLNLNTGTGSEGIDFIQFCAVWYSESFPV